MIAVGDRSYPVVSEPTDAIVRVVLTCVCGGDLWQYRGESPIEPGPIGHEFVGVVEDIGTEVRGIATGDLVIAPTAYCDGTCPNCAAGIANARLAGGFWAVGGIDGGQGEAVRVPFADATVVRIPGSGHSNATMRSLLALSDVMGTGHHAAVSAGVKPGDVVAVIGDGAVGLCAILAARRLGAARIIALSRSPARQALARSFGAADVVAERGAAAAEAVLELTDRVGVDAALECVGTAEAFTTAVAVTRPGGMVGYVGVPHGVEVRISTLFFRNIGLRGGAARYARTSPNCSTMSWQAASIPAGSSTSRPTSRGSRMPTQRWTNDERSSRSCGSERPDRGAPDRRRTEDHVERAN